MVDVHHETLRVWIKKAPAEGSRPAAQPSQGLPPAEREELPCPRKEVRDLKQANEIPKPASALFARELDPRHH